MIRRPWIKEIDTDCYIVTNDGETFFFKTDTYYKASGLIEYVNNFIDAMEDLRNMIAEWENVLLIKNATKQTRG